jgi:hypothetical protein
MADTMSGVAFMSADSFGGCVFVFIAVSSTEIDESDLRRNALPLGCGALVTLHIGVPLHFGAKGEIDRDNCP